MIRKFYWAAALSFLLFLGNQTASRAQDNPDIHVVVNMVQLNVAVTDSKGNYITGLRPSDFVIYEDGIKEKPATFAEGDAPARRLDDLGQEVSSAANAPESSAGSSDGTPAQTFDALISGSNVFVLFDTSDY